MKWLTKIGWYLAGSANAFFYLDPRMQSSNSVRQMRSFNHACQIILDHPYFTLFLIFMFIFVYVTVAGMEQRKRY